MVGRLGDILRAFSSSKSMPGTYRHWMNVWRCVFSFLSVLLTRKFCILKNGTGYLSVN